MRLALLTAFTLAATALAQPPAPPVKLDGLYKPESIQFEGKEMADAKAKASLTLVVKDGEYRAYYAPDPTKDSHVRLFTASMTTDPSARTFELTVTDGPKKGERRHGIYKLDAGKLTVCYGPADKPRPAVFATSPNSGHFCETWVAEAKK